MFSSKLKSRWSRRFTITQVFPYGTVELSQNSRPNFKVNGHRIKHYFGGDIPQMVVSDLNKFGDWVKLSDPKQELRGRHPMLIRKLSWIFKASRARGFVLRSQELQILSFIWEIQYLNLID
ncbi:hypothetical protein Tco_0992758 [Tanacetum coccineum]|uniref:Ribosomal protein S3 n=1 Tax=Tanacetum coccineum TaxID=301880 RepID=A0ABQ5F3H6_9ASTR